MLGSEKFISWIRDGFFQKEIFIDFQQRKLTENWRFMLRKELAVIVYFHICLPCDFIETLITQKRLQTTRHFWPALNLVMKLLEKNDQRAGSTPAASNTILPSFHILLNHPHPILVDSWLK